ncbi:hypothetical protein CQW23_22448 [Capsicum baccatum]|uniref:Uncharacterized protein n=1 Tax=Capsicum baccatum TaxID=33114 RepID=A0A2G2W0W7_CAPBA|nr:hypothetical protein CQW23_22448 [Capsicum baccatum]
MGFWGVTQVQFEMYPIVKKTVSEWLVVCPIKERSVVDVPKKVEQPYTLNDPAFQEDDSQIHEIDIDENEIPNTLNDPDGMLIDMEESEEEEKEKDEEEEEDEDRYGDDDDDEDENEDKDDDVDDDEEEEEEEGEEGEEDCELH